MARGSDDLTLNLFLRLNTLLHKRLYNIDIRDLYRGGELSSL